LFVIIKKSFNLIFHRGGERIRIANRKKIPSCWIPCEQPATRDLSIRSISKLAIGARIGIAPRCR